jgi:type IV pilus assembly protein PilW
MKPTHKPTSSVQHGYQSGFSLVELMIAITISLMIMLALVAVFMNISRTNNEMAKTNIQIENGRFAIQLLQADVAHAGFWGTFVPQFDNQTLATIPNDAPTAVPDPCLAFASWDLAYKRNLIGIPVQTVPSGNCTTLVTNQKADTDVLVVRHAASCAATAGVTSGECEAQNANKVYFQSSLCSAVAQLGSTSTTIKLAANSNGTDGFYVGKTIRLLSGTGGGQTRSITAYNGTSKVATVNTAWATTPDSSTNYSFDELDYVFDKTGLSLLKRNCSTTADVRKFISNIYYVRNYSSPGDGIPTLVRSQFDFVGGVPAHTDPVPMVEGIEGFRVEYGIDDKSDTGEAVNYAQAVAWVNPADQKSARNRGDGSVDGAFVRCPPANTSASTTVPSTYPAASVCDKDKLSNVVAVKIYVLARSKEATAGYNDTKTYALGSTTLGPFNDAYKRHVFSSTVRLITVSGRRETPGEATP